AQSRAQAGIVVRAHYVEPARHARWLAIRLLDEGRIDAWPAHQPQCGPFDVEAQPLAKVAFAPQLRIEQQQAAVAAAEHALDATEQADAFTEVDVDRLRVALQRTRGEHVARGGEHRLHALDQRRVGEVAG